MRHAVLAKPLLALSLFSLALPAVAQVDETNRIIDEGLNHSQVMQTAQQLTDGIGGRMTNSPQMRQAEDWTARQFRDWGLSNVRKEGFDFGRGWSIVSSHARMVSPRPIALTAIPVAWTPATNGPISAPIVVAPMKRDRDFDAWRGRLAGKIVLVSLPGTGSEPNEAPFQRLGGGDIAKLDTYRQPGYDPAGLEKRIRQATFARRLDAFLKAEGALAWARISYRDGKLVHGEGYAFRVGDTPALPGIEIAAEDYRRLARLAKSGPAPVLEINNDVKFDDSDRNAYNIIAEIPGTDPKAGYVMAGAHLDSWVAGDGAADNGAGSAMIMEAARILVKTGARPKRTIRFALWAGEEQGLLGSLAYVEKYLATRAPAPGAETEGGLEQYYRWRYRFPITPRPGYADLKAYFNIDNGSGKLRGIHAEGNVAAVPMLKEWIAPFAGMGVTSVVAAPTGGTDHVFMQAVGVPGYQFIQDPLDYGSRVHHSDVDTFDHLKAEDMRQGAVVLAGILLKAANSDKVLPRMPLPTEGVPTDPFRYDDPSDD
jgi:carboxypeptidase Q